MALIWTSDPCVETYPAGYWIPGGRRSGTMKDTEMVIFGTDQRLKLPMRLCTTAWEVKEMLSKKLDTAPENIQFVVKRGCSYAKLQECDQMPAKVMVRGITSWARKQTAYEHPIVIIGAGHSGLRQALEFVKWKIEDFVVFDRWDRVGGDAWLKQANSTSKLQTELGTYHLQFDERYPVPAGMPTYPTRDEMLKHFEEVAGERGILPHVKLNTRVCSMEKPSRMALTALDRVYNLFHVPTEDFFTNPESLETHIMTGGDGAQVTAFPASAVLMFPGGLTVAKRETYKGEDVFEGTVAYGMFNDFDPSQVRGNDVAIVGMGAFSVENMRTCLEQGALKCYLVTRRKNLVLPRALSWFINQSIVPPLAATVVSKLEGPYALADEDPWTYYGITASQDRQKVRVMQRARFPISDVFFLACYFNRAEVIVDKVKRLTASEVCLETGNKLEVKLLIKVFGFTASRAVDKLMHVEDMMGYWVNKDCRRWIWCESPGLEFSRIGSTTLSPGAILFTHVATHYLMYPKDFSDLLRLKVVPSFKPEVGSTNPCYVLNVRDSTAVNIALSQACPFLRDRDFNEIKRARQLECHPLEAYLQELQTEWTNYCELLGEDQDDPEYPYTKRELETLMQNNDLAIL